MFWDDYADISADLKRVRAVISKEVSRPGGTIAEGLGDLVTRDSKLLRPGFTILASRIASRDTTPDEGIIRVAAAIEMLHLGSLVHDDIVDDSPTRRGGPTLHRRFGSRRAVLMGDYLLARSFALVAEHAEPESATRLAAAGSHIIKSEISEIEVAPGIAPSVRRYIRRVTGKTAVLFALSFHVGAIHGRDDANGPITTTLRRIGYNIGVGFQIVDDLLDLFGDPTTTGKPIGSDIRQGVPTLPFVLAARATSPKRLASRLSVARRRSRFAGRALGFIGRKSIDRVRRIVESAGGREAAEAFARRYTARALREIDRLPASDDRRILTEVTTKLLIRAS